MFFSYNIDDGTESITLPKTPQYVYKQPNDIELAQKPKTKYVYLPVIPNPKFVKKPRRVLYAYNDFCPVHQKLRLHHYGETYDPRWWYMPLNAVHAPKSRRYMELVIININHRNGMNYLIERNITIKLSVFCDSLFDIRIQLLLLTTDETRYNKEKKRTYCDSVFFFEFL